MPTRSKRLRWATWTALALLVAFAVDSLTEPAAAAPIEGRPGIERPGIERLGDGPPNVLLIIVDDLGAADLGCLGSKDLQTPAIDRLFADSLVLDQFYANCPVCSPTRASVLTGCYPDRVGVPGVIRTNPENSWGYLSEHSPTLADVLGERDYRTGAIGKWHLGLTPANHPLARGFDFFHGFLGDMMDDYFHHRRHGNNYMRLGRETIDPTGHATDVFSEWAIDYIDDSAKRASPWFLYLAYNAPHTPIQPPQEWLEKVKAREVDIDDKRASLVALIEHMDAGIGRVLAALDRSGQRENTIVVFTSDNGGQTNVGANNGPLRDGKGSMYEGGLRIPGCIQVPGKTSAGQSTGAMCATMDLMPTLIELAGGQVPTDIDGRSLVTLIDGIGDGSIAKTADPWNDRELYFVRREGGQAYSGLTIESVRKGRHKLVHNFPTQSFELYDLVDDPLESQDLAKKQPKLLREMQSSVQRHIQRGGRVPWQRPN